MKKRILNLFVVALVFAFSMPSANVEAGSAATYPVSPINVIGTGTEFSVPPTEHSHYSPSVLEPSLTPSSSSRLSIDELRVKFPSGKYWNHKVERIDDLWDESFADSVTDYPCAMHDYSLIDMGNVGDYGCNYFDTGVQCHGFAHKLGYDYSGGIRPTEWKELRPGRDASVDEILQNILVGDIIRYAGHTIFVIDVDDEGVWVAEDNINYNCYINWDRYVPWDEIRLLGLEWVSKCPVSPLFLDVPNDAWYLSYVEDLVNQNIICGRNDDIFDPQGGITRAEFAKILAYASGDDLDDYKADSNFEDCIGHWSENNINWAYQNGVVKGMSDDIFAPNDNITRQEMASMLVRYKDYKGMELTKVNAPIRFDDEAKIAFWAKADVAIMQQAGVIHGKPGNIFDPTGNATRAEASKMVSTFLRCIAF